jgi:hypothetical protein
LTREQPINAVTSFLEEPTIIAPSRITSACFGVVIDPALHLHFFVSASVSAVIGRARILHYLIFAPVNAE